MRALLLTLALSACTKSSVAPSHREVFIDPLLDGWVPNYAYPFVEPPDLRLQRRRLERACRGGDPSACWKAGLAPETAENCRRGHHMSCRALIVGEGLPGAHGRHWRRCHLDTLDQCDLVALWAECAAEFTRSCRDVRNVLDELGIRFVATVLGERITTLARAGCAQGLEYDCLFLAALGTADEARFADEMRCRYDDSACEDLARRVFLEGDQVRAHRFLEYGCQRGIMSTCESLGVLYLRSVLREPVNGRGARLLEMACRFRVEKDAFQHAAETYLRQCLDRTGMWESYDRAFYEPVPRIEPP